MHPSDSSSIVSLTGNDTDSVLLKIHLLRQRNKMMEARLMLEEALVRWPQNVEIKELLLQTEKDELALKRNVKKGPDGAGLIDDPKGLVFLGAVGAAGAAVSLYMFVDTTVYPARNGINAQQEVRARVETPNRGGSYKIPVYSGLTTWFVFLCLFAGLIWYAVRSYRA